MVLIWVVITVAILATASYPLTVGNVFATALGVGVLSAVTAAVLNQKIRINYQ